MSMNISSQVLSKLGSTESKIPLAVKDVFNSLGCTYFSYDAGGKVEGADRFIDEFGTCGLWLFGIPAYKKLIDKTVFKKAGISPDVDVRILNNKNYYEAVKKHTKDKKILKEITTAGENLGKTKGLNIAKFAMALGLTMMSFLAMTKGKQFFTRKNIEKEYLNKQVNETENNNNYINFEEPAKIFSEFSNNKYNSQPSFKSSIITKAAENIMLSPVKNMMVLDMGISGERLATARTKGEFQEFAIKEGSFLFFVYGAGKLIQKGIDTVSEKLFKTPINLDSKFLASKLSENILSDSKMQNDIDIFCKKFAANKNDSALYEYIFKNPENTVVKAAKESGIITMMKDKKNIGEIDTRKYIDSEKIKNLAKDLKTFVNIGSKENQKKFLNRVKTFKVASIILNVAICCFALGYAVPKMMYKHRKNNQNGQSSFHVRTEYEKELKKREENSLKQKNV